MGRRHASSVMVLADAHACQIGSFFIDQKVYLRTYWRRSEAELVNMVSQNFTECQLQRKPWNLLVVLILPMICNYSFFYFKPYCA